MGTPKVNWSDPEVQEAHALGRIDDEGKEVQSQAEVIEGTEETRQQSERVIIVAPSGYGMCDCRGHYKFYTHVWNRDNKYYCLICGKQMMKYA